MTISDVEFSRLCRLSRIHVDDESAEALKKEIGGIVSWLDKLKNVDLGENLVITQSEFLTIERDDNNIASFEQDTLLKNAPDKKHGFFVVPKVVE